MSIRRLPSELVSLIHYIELNKSGWWEEAVQKLIVSTVWLMGKPLTIDEIVKNLNDNFQVTINEGIIDKGLVSLSKKEILIKIQDEKYKIAEEELKKYEKDLSEADTNEKNVKNFFSSLLKKQCSELDESKVWTSFNDQLLLPLIQKQGANIYQVLSGGKLEPETIPLEQFLGSYKSKYNEGLRAVIRDFLNPKNEEVRSYILRLLNAYFFVESTSLKESTIASFQKAVDSRIKFYIFVDTNFLFSALGLHDNPSNEVAVLLIDLIKQLSSRIDVQLYVVNPTVKEARDVINWQLKDFEGIKVTPKMAEILLTNRTAGRVLESVSSEVKKTSTSIDVKSYLEPYASNLMKIIASKGIKLYNENLDNLKIDQKVIDDISISQVHEKKYGEKAKTYERLEHDIVLWHFVDRKRPDIVESPIEVGYWVVTVDYRFLGFDLWKTSKLKMSYPICVHPTTLIQMLQFWVPRSKKLEEAILSSISLPFVFSEFDPAAEKVSVMILQSLSRFQDLEDIPTETLKSILFNEAFRAKAAGEHNEEKRIELVKEELITLHKEVSNELVREKRKVASLVEKIEEAESDSKMAKATIQAKESEITLSKKRLTQEKKEKLKLDKSVVKLTSTTTEMRIKLEKLEQERKDNCEWREKLILPATRLIVLYLVLYCVLLIIFVGLLRTNVVINIVLSLLFTYMYVVFSVSNLEKRYKKIRTWNFYKYFKLNLWTICIGLGGFIIYILWDVLKTLIAQLVSQSMSTRFPWWPH